MLVYDYSGRFSTKLYKILQLFRKTDFSYTSFISPWNFFKLKNQVPKSTHKHRPYAGGMFTEIKKYQKCTFCGYKYISRLVLTYIFTSQIIRDDMASRYLYFRISAYHLHFSLISYTVKNL